MGSDGDLPGRQWLLSDSGFVYSREQQSLGLLVTWHLTRARRRPVELPAAPRCPGCQGRSRRRGGIFTSTPSFCSGWGLGTSGSSQWLFKMHRCIANTYALHTRKGLVFKSIQTILSNASSLHPHSVQGPSVSTRCTCRRQCDIMHFKSVQRADLAVSVLTIIKHFLKLKRNAHTTGKGQGKQKP